MTEYIIGGGLVISILSLVCYVNNHRKETDTKISKVYGRLDENKIYTEIKYRDKDVCQEIVTQIRNDLTEIKADVKLLLGRSDG